MSLLTVALTSTVPTACFGATAVQVVCVLQLIDFASEVPKWKRVAPAPVAKPVPVRVTFVPPPSGPEVGLTPATVGTNLNLSAADTVLVPPRVVTVTSTIAGDSAGE